MTTPQVTGYSFKYTTTVEVDDGTGTMVPTEVPTEFVVGGIAEDVAQGIAAGLELVPSIDNVESATILQGSQPLDALGTKNEREA